MRVQNLLDFLNKSKELRTLDYITCSNELINFLDLIIEDEQFVSKIDLGIIYISQRDLEQHTIVDGLNRILSLSLLLHAVCECYKKTTEKNEKAISTIRNKYLLNGEKKTKLRLPQDLQKVYDKIIFGERLSGREKDTHIFQLLHKFWTQIKEDHLQAATIFKKLQKITVYINDIDDIPARDIYFTLNNRLRPLNQLLLIGNYMKNMGLSEQWSLLQRFYKENSIDMMVFFKDFFVTKFNFKEFKEGHLYETFVNYFETMLQYCSEEELIEKIKRASVLYRDIINVNMPNESLKKALIQIKIHNGEDTFAYLLNIYEDYLDNNISEATFKEILLTIDEYLKNRLKTPNNVTFNELVNYLNAFIICK